MNLSTTARAGRATHGRQHGLTLVELLVVVTVVGILLTLAAPSFRELILMQRLKGINAQIVTDMQFARTEAAARGLPVTVRVSRNANAGWSCYMLYTDTAAAAGTGCDCLNPEATRCTAATATEVRTVIVPNNLSVGIGLPPAQADRFAFDPFNGSMRTPTVDGAEQPPQPFVIRASIDTSRALGTVVSVAGRPSVCAPAGSSQSEPACP